MKQVRITVHGAPASYDVLIEAGLLGRSDHVIENAVDASRYAIVTDSNVEQLHADPLANLLSAGGERAPIVAFPAGEAHKTRETWAGVSDRLLRYGLGRDGCIVALGGGVVGDVAGFVAATYLRGIPFVQIPTSLLAMIDASIGGKTGVDTAAGKNLVGAFYQPNLVLIDPVTLQTLPETELRSGLAEAIKHGAIADADYLAWITADTDAILARDPRRLARLVHRSVEIKAEVVAADPEEHGRRAALNFGHTAGHAIELIADYSIPHGHAVAQGMVIEARMAEEVGVARAGTADRIMRALEAVGLPVEPPAKLTPETLLAAAKSDKKSRAGRLRWSLISEPGRVARDESGGWTHAFDDRVVREALARALPAR